MPKLKDFEIILGTYEEFVVGYRFTTKDVSDFELKQSFASHSHNSSVRCVTHSEHYLASGGTDDRIVVYDLKSRKEHCMLTHHNGTVNCLAFTEGHTHLISGGSDGMLAITRVGNWQLEKVWEKAHKGASIIDIAVHPSNKLALTLGADSTLRTWNLVKGRQAYVINLNSKSKDPRSLQYIKWAPGGVKFVLCGGLQTDIWSIESGGILKAIEHKNRVSSCLFYTDDTLAIGFENGTLSLLDIDNKISIKEIKAHTARLKSIAMCKGSLITCSSNGEVKIWNKELEEVSACSTGCRNTCITVVVPKWIKKEEKEDEETVNEFANVDNSFTVTDIEDEEKSVKQKKKKKKRSDQFEKSVFIVEDALPKKKKRKSKNLQPFEEIEMESNQEQVTKKDKKVNLQEGSNSNNEWQIVSKKKKKKLKEKL